MATITGLLWWRHLRAEPNQYVLHYVGGKLARKGAGLSYWFYPLSAAIAQVPVEDCEATFLLRERTSDLQEVAVQCTVVYRVVDAEKAASRANFTVSLHSGAWVEKPLEKLAAFWAARVREPVRAHVSGLALGDAVRTGAVTVRAAVAEALQKDTEIGAMGLGVVGIQIDQIAPPPELAKALETPTRESIQQKADEAVFSRRAAAVEKERVIKENELATQIELARRQDDLIRRNNANKLLEAEGKASAERTRVQSDLELQAMTAEGYARDVRTKASGDAEARRVVGEADAAAEAARGAAWKGVPPEVIMGLAANTMAGKLQNVEHLTITPDTLGDAVAKLVKGRS